jgi:hypothetical protein
MKNKYLIALLISVAILASLYLANIGVAADWSQYESGRDNIRLDGYQGQPGYIAFTDGHGTVKGYIWWSTFWDRPVYASAGVLDIANYEIETEIGDQTVIGRRGDDL